MTNIILIVIAVELAVGIFLMTRIARKVDERFCEIWYQLVEIWRAVREQS